jgi:hypothetical protein
MVVQLTNPCYKPIKKTRLSDPSRQTFLIVFFMLIPGPARDFVSLVVCCSALPPLPRPVVQCIINNVREVVV